MIAPGQPGSRLPGLDGIRGVAVLAVLGYHLDLVWTGGGFLGVEVFFALSGFLITHLLLAEYARDGRIDLTAFARSRARRLAPALVVGVLATVLAYETFLPAEAPEVRTDALASLLWMQNWHLVLAGVPYGAGFSRPPPLLHLWSLGVEVQLYLGWVLLLVAVLLRVRRSVAVGATVALAVASAVAMALRYTPDGGSTAYYATDARASGFLLGAALALARAPIPEPSELRLWIRELLPERVPPRLLDVAGVLALGALLAGFVLVDEFDAGLYRWGGFLATGVLVVLLITAVTRVDGVCRRVLDNRLLAVAGSRSYGLYLYHWPVFALVRGAPGQGWRLDALALAVTVLITELSYRFLENPIRRAGPAAVTRRVRLDGWTVRWVSVWAGAMTLSLLAATGATSIGQVKAGADRVPNAAATGSALVIGDSITLSSAAALQAALGPDTVLAATVGKQFSAAPAMVAEWARTNTGPVVINLGANGTVTRSDVEALITAAGHRRVVLVGVSVPRRWWSGNNAVLRTVAAGHAPDVVFVDWAAVVAADPAVLGPDRVHPVPRGQELLATAIARAVDR